MNQFTPYHGLLLPMLAAAKAIELGKPAKAQKHLFDAQQKRWALNNEALRDRLRKLAGKMRTALNQKQGEKLSECLADWYELIEDVQAEAEKLANVEPAMNARRAEDALRRGVKIVEAASRGGKTRRTNHGAMRRRCDELRRQRPELSANGIDKIVADEFDVTSKTIQNARRKKV